MDSQEVQINNWDSSQVERAERTWGHKTPQYTLDMFNFLRPASSYLDLGCGFGRFLEYLLQHNPEPDYIGYDSSPDMIQRIQERFPHFSARTFTHDITHPIRNNQQAILCSAVLIHITLKEQQKVLKNISNSSPRLITFDINSPSENWLRRGTHFERIIPPGFRMTWQSHYEMTKRVLNLFPDYNLKISFYPLHTNRHKVVYFLKKP